MDNIARFFRNIASHPTTNNISSSTTEKKIAILEDALNIQHCSTSTLLGALKLTCSCNENVSTEPATSEFAKKLYQTTLSSAETQMLQKSLIVHLPGFLQEQAKAIITPDDQDATQSGNKLSAWVGVNHVVAKLLQNFPDIQRNPFLALDALCYAWGHAASAKLHIIDFHKYFDDTKNKFLSNLTYGTEEFNTARNNFNNTVREQLLMFFPAIKKQHHCISVSNISYEEKKSRISDLLGLHLDLIEAIKEVSSPSSSNSLKVQCKAMLALCDNDLFISSENHDLKTDSLIELKAKYVNSQTEAGNPDEAADLFDDALMRALAMGLYDDTKEACLNILDSAKSMEEMKPEIKGIVSSYYGFFCRMTEPY